MALSLFTIAEVRTGGSDTLNGGLFDPSKVLGGGWTDGAATSANTASPVFSSASYTFVAGDVGAWLYINSGTNWTPGWYQIASVTGGAATLSAAIGAGVLAGNQSMTTVIGCATVASPSSATWAIDYSQQNAAQFTYTDLASAGTGLTVSSAATPFGRHMVGNGLVITGGTNFNIGRYVIASVAAGTFIATVVGPTNITTGAGVTGTGGQGGAFFSPGKATGTVLTQTTGPIFLKNDGSIHSITTATINISQGTLSVSAVTVVGYGTNRTFINTDAPPTLQLNVASATLVQALMIVVNVILDGNLQTAATLASTNSAVFMRSVLKRFTALTAGNCLFIRCYATLNTATIFVGSSYGCEAYANTATPFSMSPAASVVSRCIASSNTGASTDGFVFAATFSVLSNCIAYANGRDGVRAIGTRAFCEDVHCEANTGVGFNKTSTWLFLKNCATYNNTGGVSGGSPNFDGQILLTSTAFINAAAGDFSLNTAAGGGAALRAASSLGMFPAGLSTGYMDIGAVQHQDAGGVDGGSGHSGFNAGFN